MTENTEENVNMIPELRINEILKMLPHRYPFLLVDTIKNIVPGESGIGVKNVTFNEPFFEGHFPENPIMPGVLQIEAMAQTAGVIVVTSFPKEEQDGCRVFFMTVDDVKFRKPIIPGDVLEMKVKKEQAVRNVFKFRAESYVNGKLVAQAVFSAMVMKKS